MDIFKMIRGFCLKWTGSCRNTHLVLISMEAAHIAVGLMVDPISFKGIYICLSYVIYGFFMLSLSNKTSLIFIKKRFMIHGFFLYFTQFNIL